MKQINTKTIINFLPFEPSAKLDLLEKYDSLPREEQLRISDLVWDTFYSFYEIKIKDNFDKAIQEAEKNGTKTDQTFYGKVLERTDKEISDILSSAADSTDLSAARKSMEQIVGEINTVKKTKSPKAN